ncbi:MAG: hypothetical protein ACREWG_16775, partial [Gammaproteobacteria bacterium]
RMTRPSKFRINTIPHRAVLGGHDATFAAVRSARRRAGEGRRGDHGAGVDRGCPTGARSGLRGAAGRDRARAAA